MNMEPNELMISDLVYYNPNVFIEDEYETHKPLSKFQIESGEDIDLAIEGCYEPISLIEDILILNFKLKDNKEHFYALPCDRLALSVKFDTVYVSFEYTEGVWVDILQLNFVHQLQHFLRSRDMDDLANNLKLS